MTNQYKYSLVNDHGIIIDRPASMNGNRGPYYPTIIKTSDIAGWQAPYDHACYFSTDHASNEMPDGGTWLYLSSGDPTQPWVSYDDAVAAGHFDYLPSKPLANPIYDASMSGADGSQMETPHARVIDGVVYMTTHNNNGPNGQTTSMNKSSDGVNFNWVRYVTLIDNDTYVGTSHTGYTKWHENTSLPELPYNYIAYGIGAGGEKSDLVQWGFNNPEEEWTLLYYYKRDSGRVFDGVSGAPNDPQLVFRLNPSLFVPQDDGSVIAIATTKSQGSAGAGLAITKSVQCQLDEKGRIPISKVDYFLTPQQESVNYQELTDTLEYDGRKFMIYRGVGAGDSSTAVSHVGIIEYELVDGSLELLNPAKPESTDIDFKELSNLPAQLTPLTGQGSFSFTSQGLEITIPAGESDGFYLPDITDNVAIADISWMNMRQEGNVDWVPHVGFAKDYIRGSAVDLPNRVECLLNPDVNNMIVATYKNGVYTKEKGYIYDAIGDGPSTATPKRTNYGCRWFPQDNKAGLLTSSIERGFPHIGDMPSGRYTPFIEIENQGTQPLTVIIEGITFGTIGAFDFQWALQSKPTNSTAVISDPTVKNFDFMPDAEGSYSFSLVASDKNTQSSPVSQAFSIEAPNQPPTANAGPDQSVAAATQFTLDGTGSQDTDGAIIEYRWTQTAGDTVTLNLDDPARPTAKSPSKTTAQRLTFQLVTVDDEGAESSPGTVNIDVAAFAVSEMLKLLDTRQWTVVNDGSVQAFEGRSNREAFRFLVTPSDGIQTSAEGYFLFDQPGVHAVEVISTPTSKISSVDDPYMIRGDVIAARIGDLQTDENGNLTLTFVLYVTDDKDGLVMTAKVIEPYQKASYFRKQG